MIEWFSENIRRRPVFWFFTLAYAVTCVPLLLGLVFSQASGFLSWISLFAPAISGLLVTGICDGKEGLEDLLARLVRWRVPWYVYLFVFGIPLVLVAGTILLHDGPGETLAYIKTIPRFLPFLFGMTILMFVPIAGEEIGWRGFALPRLQARYGPLVASLIIGFWWGLWHLPSALKPDSVLNLAPLPISLTLFTLGTIGFSFLYTWIWRQTSGSLLLVCAFHTFYDGLNSLSAAAYPYIINQFWYYLAVLLVILLIVIWSSRKQPEFAAGPTEHRSVIS